MNCERVREAISARFDGEDPGLDDATVTSHRGGCRSCRAFAERGAALHRAVRLAPAPVVPDLLARILAAIGTEGHSEPGVARERILRATLALLAAVQLAVALPALFGSDAGIPVHSARHLGSFGIAFAVGFAVAAWRPSRIPGLLPVLAALVASLVVTSALDIAAGRTAAAAEADHATQIVGLVAVWLLGRPGLRLRVATP